MRAFRFIADSFEFMGTCCPYYALAQGISLVGWQKLVILFFMLSV